MKIRLQNNYALGKKILLCLSFKPKGLFYTYMYTEPIRNHHISFLLKHINTFIVYYVNQTLVC